MINEVLIAFGTVNPIGILAVSVVLLALLLVRASLTIIEQEKELVKHLLWK
jgi:hypothetical protein